MTRTSLDTASVVAPPGPFNLTRQFSILALVCVVAFAAALGFVISRLLSNDLLQRDAVVTMEFVQSIVSTDETAPYFLSAGQSPLHVALEDTIKHFAKMPDVLRANVYTRDRRAIWSSDPNIIGRVFGANDELDHALEGVPVFKSGFMSKEEHVAAKLGLAPDSRAQFVEIYVPVRAPGGQVVGVVELYKTPRALFEAIAAGQRTIAINSVIGGLLLYAILIGIVRRANRTMHDQQRRLLEGERLGAVGEMAATVAHAIRNPLASIRTSVEVALDRDPGNFREPGEDIIAEVDKVEEWIRELLAFSRPGSMKLEALDLNALVRKSLAACERHSARAGVRVESRLDDAVPAVRGDAALVEHVLISLVTNALDSMPDGGALIVTTSAVAGGSEVTVQDSGGGIRPEDLPHIFEPFFTTKTRGTGLGLPLARRVIERMGGALAIESQLGAGSKARLLLKA
jgi:signal transduction histidine kinase